MRCPLDRRSLAATLVLLACVGPLCGAPDLLASYDGKYAGQGRFEREVKVLEAAYGDCLQTVQQRLALTPALGKEIQVVVRDALPAEPSKLAPFTAAPFQTRWDNDEVQIVLHAEFIVNGRCDVQQSLTHELAHAVMRTHMTPEAYRKVPTWLREGVAVWCAGQIEEKVASLYRTTDTPIDMAIKRLDDVTSDDSLSRYAEYGLAIERIEQEKGVQGVQSLVAAVAGGMDAQAAVEQVTGLPWNSFVSGAQAYAKSRVHELEPDGLQEFKQIKGSDRARRYAAVVEQGAEFLKHHRESPLTGNVLYYMVKAHRLQKQLGAAKNRMQMLAGKHAYDCDMWDEAVYQLGAAYAEARQWGPSIRTFQELVRDHPDSNLQDRALYYLALCSTRGGNKARAKQYVALFDRSFPNSEMRNKMAELRSQLH